MGIWVYWQWNFNLNIISPEVRLLLMEEGEIKERNLPKKVSVYIVYIFGSYSAGIWRRFMYKVGRTCLSFLYPTLSLDSQALLNWDNVLCPLTFLPPYWILQNPNAIFPPISINKIQPYVTLSTLCSSPVGRHCLCSEVCSSPACGWFTTAQCPCTAYLPIDQFSAPSGTGFNRC